MKVPRPGRYILRCMAGGYHTAFYPVEAQYTASKTTFDAGDFYLQEMSTQIAEAVVTGTKIRMFYKGDTLVYNASAFQLPEGSMLNDLVKQLPGAELRDGNIYINGRLVENMLIGGKNFFNGDPMAALANLPAYVINSVKAYEKRGEKSETTGTSMGDEQFVMDVHLKRKYIGTYLGQLVGGYGTDDRYQAGLFLMRFDDRQSFNIMGDFNNRNQNTCTAVRARTAATTTAASTGATTSRSTTSMNRTGGCASRREVPITTMPCTSGAVQAARIIWPEATHSAGRPLHRMLMTSRFRPTHA